MGGDAGFGRREREAARTENRIGYDRRVAARGRLSNGRGHSDSARLLSHREHGARELARRFYHHREAHTGGSAPSARALQHSYALGLLNFPINSSVRLFRGDELSFFHSFHAPGADRWTFKQRSLIHLRRTLEHHIVGDKAGRNWRIKRVGRRKLA